MDPRRPIAPDTDKLHELADTLGDPLTFPTCLR